LYALILSPILLTCPTRVVSWNYTVSVGFEVLTAVSKKIAVFWVVAPCSLVEVYQRFRGPCCLHQPRRQQSSYTVSDYEKIQSYWQRNETRTLNSVPSP
jgi:hypothetical protein